MTPATWASLIRPLLISNLTAIYQLPITVPIAKNKGIRAELCRKTYSLHSPIRKLKC